MSADIKNVVLGTVYMHLDTGTMSDVVEIIETNFEENELRKAIVMLFEALGETPPDWIRNLCKVTNCNFISIEEHF